MAHFYGTVQGHRGQASRLGSKSSGFRSLFLAAANDLDTLK